MSANLDSSLGKDKEGDSNGFNSSNSALQDKYGKYAQLRQRIAELKKEIAGIVEHRQNAITQGKQDLIPQIKNLKKTNALRVSDLKEEIEEHNANKAALEKLKKEAEKTNIDLEQEKERGRKLRNGKKAETKEADSPRSDSKVAELMILPSNTTAVISAIGEKKKHKRKKKRIKKKDENNKLPTGSPILLPTKGSESKHDASSQNKEGMQLSASETEANQLVEKLQAMGICFPDFMRGILLQFAKPFSKDFFPFFEQNIESCISVEISKLTREELILKVPELSSGKWDQEMGPEMRSTGTNIIMQRKKLIEDRRQELTAAAISHGQLDPNAPHIKDMKFISISADGVPEIQSRTWPSMYMNYVHALFPNASFSLSSSQNARLAVNVHTNPLTNNTAIVAAKELLIKEVEAAKREAEVAKREAEAAKREEYEADIEIQATEKESAIINAEAAALEAKATVLEAEAAKSKSETGVTIHEKEVKAAELKALAAERKAAASIGEARAAEGGRKAAERSRKAAERERVAAEKLADIAIRRAEAAKREAEAAKYHNLSLTTTNANPALLFRPNPNVNSASDSMSQSSSGATALAPAANAKNAATATAQATQNQKLKIKSNRKN